MPSKSSRGALVLPTLAIVAQPVDARSHSAGVRLIDQTAKRQIFDAQELHVTDMDRVRQIADALENGPVAGFPLDCYPGVGCAVRGGPDDVVVIIGQDVTAASNNQRVARRQLLGRVAGGGPRQVARSGIRIVTTRRDIIRRAPDRRKPTDDPPKKAGHEQPRNDLTM
jgi:hypothetical protein